MRGVWGNTAAILERRNGDLQVFIALKEEAYDTLRGVKLDGMPMAVGTIGDPTSRAALDIGDTNEKYDQAIASIAKEIREALDRKIAVDLLVKELAPEEQKILEYRYVLVLDWKVIQDRMGYAKKYTQEVERIVIDKLSEYISLENHSLRH